VLATTSSRITISVAYSSPVASDLGSSQSWDEHSSEGITEGACQLTLSSSPSLASTTSKFLARTLTTTSPIKVGSLTYDTPLDTSSFIHRSPDLLTLSSTNNLTVDRASYYYSFSTIHQQQPINTSTIQTINNIKRQDGKQQSKLQLEVVSRSRSDIPGLYTDNCTQQS
jgi:hypothetical protein